jgi:hypothetical protein
MKHRQLAKRKSRTGYFILFLKIPLGAYAVLVQALQ